MFRLFTSNAVIGAYIFDSGITTLLETRIANYKDGERRFRENISGMQRFVVLLEMEKREKL